MRGGLGINVVVNEGGDGYQNVIQEEWIDDKEKVMCGDGRGRCWFIFDDGADEIDVLIEKKRMCSLGLMRFDWLMEFLMVHLEELEMKKLL
ncbi:hypothetical protein Tco_1473705 [Tanacetum coccineum]